METLSKLEKRLQSGNWWVRLNTAYQLGEHVDEKTLQFRRKTLIEVLKTDRSPSVRAMAAYSLGKLGDFILKNSLVWDESNDRESEKQILFIVAQLIEVLQKDSAGVTRMACVYTLGEIGGARAASQLVEVLQKDKLVVVRWLAAQALGKLRSPKAFDALVQTLQQNNHAVAGNWIDRLGRLLSSRLLSIITDIMKTSNVASVKYTAYFASKFFFVLSFIVLISNFLLFWHAALRAAAAKALAQIGDLRAIEPLAEALRSDKSPEVRAAAAEALGSLGDLRAIEYLMQTLDPEKQLTQTLKPEKQLTQTLKRENNPMVLQATIEAIDEFRVPQAVEPLIKILTKNKSMNVCESAVHALAKLKDKRSLDIQIQKLERYLNSFSRKLSVLAAKIPIPKVREMLVSWLDNTVGLRRAIVSALGELGDPRATEVLVKVLRRDQDEKARLAAVEALGKIGDLRAVEPLLERLSLDRSASVRSTAAKVLATIGGEQARGPLLDRLLRDESDSVRREAAVALGVVGNSQAVEPLIDRLLRDESASVRFAAAEALGRLGDIRAMQALKEVLNQNLPRELHSAALSSLRKIAGLEALEILLEYKNNDKFFGLASGEINKIDESILLEIIQRRDKPKSIRLQAAEILANKWRSASDEHKLEIHRPIMTYPSQFLRKHLLS